MQFMIFTIHLKHKNLPLVKSAKLNKVMLIWNSIIFTLSLFELSWSHHG